ncbi:MAG: isocitrate lyase/PEP mutase family protein [Alphaproteobacteria bacterium]|nr:isocitrate lyase/PEP mutase family protein [Alphaproteobacteria bacterium]
MTDGNPMTANEKRKLFRNLINAAEILALPGVYDGFSTRLVAQAGYRAAFISGAGISECYMGWADVGVMGFRENLEACRYMAGCTGMAMLADGDTGYGNAVNVYFTARGFEDAGLAGVMIEDQVWPKRCGHMKGKEVISLEEAAEKIRAAAEARRDPDFIIKSRTDTLATHGIKEVIRRLTAYAEAGADLLFADALLSSQEIATVAKNVPKPLCVNMGFGIRRRSTTPLLSAREMQDLGVAVAIFPRLLTSTAIQGMKNGLAALQESLETGKVVERPDLAVSFEELNTLVGFDEVQSIEKRFLTREQLARKYG